MAVKTKRTVIKGVWALVDPDTGKVAEYAHRQTHPTAKVYSTRRHAREAQSGNEVIRRINITITPAD